MSTLTVDKSDTTPDTELHADGMPVIKKTSTPAPDPAPAVSEEALRPPKDWYSGFCNGGTPVGTGCTDGYETNKVGEPIVRCRYVAENGEKAPHLYLFCACSCHDGNRVDDDPHFKPGA